ncbi:MAG TPA: hypothetical protein VKP69_34080, partial [Isosphaeraceae bacterium]|nr:hypothetical protein [Isosphaeraceae bacterium]
MQDQGDKIATALDRLHAGGWSVGDPAFYVAGGGLVHVVIGSNGENQIRAEGATCREAWRRALDSRASDARPMSESMRPDLCVRGPSPGRAG